MSATSDYFMDMLQEANEKLRKADEIILDIHAEITTYSKYTASKVYEWKDLRGDDGSNALKEFDDNGRDEPEESLEQFKDNYNKGYVEDEE